MVAEEQNRPVCWKGGAGPGEVVRVEKAGREESRGKSVPRGHVVQAPDYRAAAEDGGAAGRGRGLGTREFAGG
jgi:hypothetical protein